jgi:hypothetical protein
MATQAWSAYSTTFTIDRETPIHRAGWTVRQEPEIRADRAVDRLRELTEEAWESGNTRHAIRCARRVLAAEAHLARMEAAYPPLKAEGPLQHWADTMSTNASKGLNEYWRKVQVAVRGAMNDNLTSMFHPAAVKS